MPSVAELRSRDDHSYAHVFFIEGLEYAWTDHADLSGTSWIGTDYGARTVIHGLKLPDTIERSIELRDGGLLEGGHLSVTLIDRDGATLVDLLGRVRDDSTMVELGEPLLPTAKGTGVTNLAGLGTSSIDARNKHIGIERIGPDGERNYFSIFPHAVTKGIGKYHPVTAWDASTGIDQDTLPAVFVTDAPRDFAGRRCALYEIHQDDDGTWKSWKDTYNGGGLVWFGQLRDEGRLEGLREWRLDCDGERSWLSGALNSARPSKSYPLIGKAPPAKTGESGIAVWFMRQRVGAMSASNPIYHDGIFFQNDFATTDDTVDEIVSHVSSQIVLARDGGAGAVAASPDGGPYADDTNATEANRWADISKERIRIKVDDGAVGSNYQGVMYICMHLDKWLTMGWDPQFQRTLPDSDIRRVRFFPVQGQQFDAGLGHGMQTAPGPGYWMAEFSTIPPSDGSTLPGAWDNDGKFRFYKPQYEGGAYFLRSSAGQQVAIAVGAGPYAEGQWGMLPAQTAKIDGSTACTDAGLWLFRGVRRTDPEEEDGEEYAQVAICSWVTDSQGRIAEDSDGLAALYIERWVDPRAFGFPFKKLNGTWGWSGSQEDAVTATPLGVIGACQTQGDAGLPDPLRNTIGRMLVSTGTATITGTANAPSYVQGQNAIYGGPQNGYLGDYESADMSLAIPREHVDVGSLFACVDALPEGFSPLAFGKYSTVGPVPADELLGEMLSSRAWAMGLKYSAFGPTFNFFPIFGPWDPADVVADINAATDLAGDVMDSQSLIAQQGIRWKAPVDRWSLEHGADPFGENAATIEGRALDPGARGRRGRVEGSQRDRGLVNRDLFNEPNLPSSHYSNWRGDWRTLWQKTASEWYARRHFPVTLPLKRTVNVGVGDLVTYTDALPASPSGTYGVTSHLARVIGHTYRIGGAHHEVTLLVDERPLSATPHCAPIARVWAYDITGGSGTLYCARPGVEDWDDGNWAGHSGKRSDVYGFAEPSWSSVGGDMTAIIYQSFDGSTWGNTVTLDVDSVDANTHQMTVSNVSGTLHRDTEKFIIPRAYADQDANSWPLSVFGVHTDNTGDHNGTTGRRFV